MRTFASIWIGLSVAVALCAQDAMAARIARVKVHGSKVYAQPSSSSRVLGTLPRGTVVATANTPKQGYYRMKTKSGLLGWIAADALVFKSSSGSAARGRSGPVDVSVRRYDRFKVRAIGGMSLFNLSEVNEYLGIDSMKAGLSGGVELGYAFTPRISALLRVERIAKSVTVLSPDETMTFLLDAVSLPVMAGVEYQVIQKKPSASKGFTLDVAVLGGMGLGTTLTSTAGDFDEPNETVYGGSTFTVYPKATGNVYISRKFALIGEVGYRILSTASAAPTTTGNGATELFAATPPAFAINMSGLVFGVGLSYSF